MSTTAPATAAATNGATTTETYHPAVCGDCMDSGNAYIYTGKLAPGEQVNLSTGSITYLVTDSLGSVRGIVNASGSLTGTCGYDAWGNPESSGGLTATTPFGYAGGYTDPSGLIYLLARYYDSATGQFISADPAIDQTHQPYGYANENPVSNRDPSGRCWWIFCGRGSGHNYNGHHWHWVTSIA